MTETDKAASPGPRVALALGVWVALACGVSVLLETAGRLNDRLAFLCGWDLSLTVSFAVAGVFALLVARFVRPRIGWGWPILVGLMLPFASCSALVAPLSLHRRLGSPLLNCEREGLDVQVCEGRDWSFMQDRLAYRRGAGPIEPSICRAFVAGVPEVGADPVNADGWVRCPDDEPAFWARRDCATLAVPGRSQCFVCSGVSNTFDHFTYVQAFDATCTEATVVYRVNLGPSQVERCRRSRFDREACEAEAWHGP